MKCEKCGTESTAAIMCPKCGKVTLWVKLSIVGLIGLVIISVGSVDDQTSDREQTIAMQFNKWDGGHNNLERRILQGMNDPGSYQHVETTYIDQGDHLVIKTRFRGKNTAGAVVLNSITATVGLNGEVQAIIQADTNSALPANDT